MARQGSEHSFIIETPNLQRPEPLQPHNTNAFALQTASPPADGKVTSSNKQQFNQQPAQALEIKPQLNPLGTSCYPGTPHPYSPENFHTQGVPQVSLAPRSERSDHFDYARYMIRRELIITSLSKFDDRPENYRSWRATFRAVVADLNFNPREELDLLIKWLGPESTDRVKRLRSVYVDSPDAGLAAAWARLEQAYGSPDVLQKALFKRLQNFPKIGNEDNRKLQELSDYLMEIELAKTELRLSGLPGLTYLDSSHFVNPVVSKLPYELQEEWREQASDYKEQHGVSFPPFSYFCSFISRQAWISNDPSFHVGEYSVPVPPSSPRYVNTAAQHRDLRGSGDGEEDPNRQCPLHKKPHPLRKCRELRAKTIQERKEVLQKLGICYRCCASYDHFAKYCKAAVKCTECHSDKHVTAMHPDPLPGNPPQPPASNPASKHGGERQSPALVINVSSSRTEECGRAFSPKSCAKICLVKVYPAGQPERATRMYAIIAEHSNRSLVKPKFFDIFGIQGQATPYTLNTCSGCVETSGRRADGFMISHIKAKEGIPLPSLVECDQMPNNREEIPTPEVAYQHPHLRHLATEIPPMDMDADILLLLGRDILTVHRIRQQSYGPDDAPFAQRLDLGWVIVGDVCLNRMRTPSEIQSFKTHI
ncbi:uncharacterized protein M6D78_018315 [Vipera latastei]